MQLLLLIEFPYIHEILIKYFILYIKINALEIKSSHGPIQ